MKTFGNFLIITFLTVLPSVSAYGQKSGDDDPVIKLFNKYEEKEGVESISISPALLGLMKEGRTGDKKTQELVSRISGLRILTISDGADGKGRSNREALNGELQTLVKKDFVEYMMVKNANERVELYVRNTSEKGALLFITSNANSTTLMHLAGLIDSKLIDAVMNGEIGISK